MASRKINIAFLWHMHQPPYEDPKTRQFLLPWTYLHATKDYYDMALMLQRHPGMRANVNFTPSLLLQLSQYASGEVKDQTIEVMRKDPAKLSRMNREFLVRTCFGVNVETMIDKFPRFKELFRFYGAARTPQEAAERLEPAEYLDLEVLFLLSWCGPYLSAQEPAASLIKKGRGFTAEERDALLDAGLAHIGRIVPLWSELDREGRVEMSFSPFYHPLLPLVHSNACAIEANHAVNLPDVRFGEPSEVDAQITLGIEYFEKTFGRKPVGMWPPEGAISDAVVHAAAAKGLRWIATDQEILRRSIGGEVSLEERLVPHEHEGVSIFFRDRVLSDQIGFVYSRWPTGAAVDNFMATLRDYADRMTDDHGIVIVAMDGENAWEYYPEGGYSFLDALYSAIEKSDFVVPTTFSEYLAQHGSGDGLDQVSTGSWIDGDLTTWIGDPVKNRAWSYLAAAFQVHRDMPSTARPKVSDDDAQALHALLMRAEASDWFWWFGKGHSSIHEREFDYLFRQNLRMIYEKIGVPVPDYLDHPVDTEHTNLTVSDPSSYIRPTITGHMDAYYKWLGAGACEFSHGSINRLQPIISMVRYGFDRTQLFFCCEGFEPLKGFFNEDTWLQLRFSRPSDRVVLVRKTPSGITAERLMVGRRGEFIPGAIVAVDDILELSIPLDFFESLRWSQPPFPIEFCVVLGRGELEIERFPWDTVIRMSFDPDLFEVGNWFV